MFYSMAQNTYMRLLRVTIHVVMLWFAIGPIPAVAGIFSDVVPTSRITTALPPSSSDIFRKNLGAANPVRYGKLLPRTGNADFFLQSDAWLNTRRDIFSVYGNSQQVHTYLNYQEYLFRKAFRTNNRAHFRSLDIKGSLAESVMDRFYAKGGWEAIDGKIGRTGFDGLYVKRNNSGKIISWFAADAKSGSAKLSETAHGRQLSPEWIKHKLKLLLATAEEEDRVYHSPETGKRLADLQDLQHSAENTFDGHPGTMPTMRQPRVLSMKFCPEGGSTKCRIVHLDVNGQQIGRGFTIDMRREYPPKSPHAVVKERIFSDIKQRISVHEPTQALAITNKIQDAFKSGKITDDSSLYRFIKNEMTNKKLANAVAQELGEVPPRGTLAGLVGRQICRQSFNILNASLVAVMIVAEDVAREQFSAESMLRASVIGGSTLGVGIGLDFVMDRTITKISEKIARKGIEQAGKELTKEAAEHAISANATKLASSIGRGGGGGLIAITGVAVIGNTLWDYQNAKISQTDMMVDVGITALTSAGSIFFTCTEIGTSICPGGGTVIGFIIGSAGAVAIGGYTYYAERNKQEMLKLQDYYRAVSDDKYFREHAGKNSQEMIEEAWKILIPQPE